jgi:hypothetical protein
MPRFVAKMTMGARLDSRALQGKGKEKMKKEQSVEHTLDSDSDIAAQLLASS